MTNPADSSVQNLLPVQAYFNTDGSFNTFIGQGQPFYATANPSQSGLTITNSTLNSSPIGNTSPSTGVFTNIATTTGTVSTQPVGATDIVNLLALQSYAAGISWKQPCAVATLANITLLGLQTIDGYTTLAGDRVLVKNQSNAANNGIYLASASTWTRSLDANSWDELVSAISFIEYGTQAGGAWFCTATPGGTLGVTAINWSQFTTSATYSAGTGLTLTGTVFSITPVGTASTYGSATQTPVFTTNASGQVSSVTNTTITPAVGSITGLGTGVATALAAGVTGSGNIVLATSPSLVTPVLGTPTSGNFSTGTFTWPTFNQNTTGTAAKATNLAGGATGSVPYQSALDTTTFLAVGSNGQVLTLASGVPSWATPTTGTVTSVGGTGTVSGISLSGTVTSSGNLTLGGSLDLSAPPAIGGTTPNTITGTTITATTSFVGSYFDASGSGGGALRSNTGTSCLQWGGGGGGNLTVDVSANLNGANAAISLAPTGTGTVTINPATASNMNNVAIGGTTPLAGTFTTLRFNSTLSLNGSTGTANYLLQSNGASAPSWVNPASLTVSAASTAITATNATNIEITDNTSSASTYYPVLSLNSSGNNAATTSSTKISFVPSTGTLTATNFVGNGSGLTGIGGGIPAGTVTNFIQSAAPTGWTQVTTWNNYAFRVVSGTGGGTGGSVAFTTAFASQTPAGSVSTSISAVSGSVGLSGSVDATTLSSSQIPSHYHTQGLSPPGSGSKYGADNVGVNSSWYDSGPALTSSSGPNTNSVGGGSSHNHGVSGVSGSFTFSSGTASSSFTGTAINLAVQYVDNIIASKN